MTTIPIGDNLIRAAPIVLKEVGSLKPSLSLTNMKQFVVTALFLPPGEPRRVASLSIFNQKIPHVIQIGEFDWSTLLKLANSEKENVGTKFEVQFSFESLAKFIYLRTFESLFQAVYRSNFPFWRRNQS